MISDLLGYGKDAALTATELAELTGLTSRNVTGQIERERQGGKIICAGNSGYYLPDSPSDAALYLRCRVLRTKTIARGTQAMQAALDAWIGQETLDFDVL